VTTHRDLLIEILDSYEAGSLAEVHARIHARAMVRDGDSAADVLDWLESQRASVMDLAALEQEHGVEAVFERIRAEARSRRS
jgi:hypothetical protein